jgi:DNA modification methylase
MEYGEFLKKKVVVAESFGMKKDLLNNLEYSKNLYPHQKDIVNFCIEGGRRAIFASFGLGKTFMQLEIAKQLIKTYNKSFLIVCPLGVSGEFKRDNLKLNTGIEIQYIKETDSIDKNKPPQIYITNYERVRMGNIDANSFIGVSMDEASIIRNLQTETTNYVLNHFKNLQYRIVATATPTPNDYIEILNYADFLGVISRGHALTRFFKRDSQKAGNLKLYDNKKEEFWQWVSTWAAFINTPADYGYDSTGYDLPDLNIVEHVISTNTKKELFDKFGERILIKNITKSGLIEVSREKRDSIYDRIEKSIDIAKNIEGNVILWHNLEAERYLLEKTLKGESYVSVYGSQKNDLKERNIIEFSESKYKYLLTKPEIAGSGCNFQDASSDMIFCGIDYKFNDFIQAIHRQYRFGQKKIVNVHIIYTVAETEIMKTLKEKWKNHKELNFQMIELVKKYGLNKEIIKSQMERQIFKNNNKVILGEGLVSLYNNDNVIALQDKEEFKNDSVNLILTSIPFGDHYEYSDNYNDFGHNHGNGKFFEQMDYLIPNLYRVLQPGRIACIHVKDRIRYSYQNGTSFTTISDFSGQTVMNFEKHGFFLIGKITITTDVVAENNQTYRLGWTEQTKDGSKMGVGLPEYVLIFRKPPSSNDNSYSDTPVNKTKDEYSKAQWQLDAHAYYRSNGDRLLSFEELEKYSVKEIVSRWKKHNKKSIYSYREHLEICKDLDNLEKLSSTYQTLPVHSNNDLVWTDVNRMNTLNARQVSNKKEKHICPLQLDIIERLIDRYSMKDEIILDPFNGLGSTTYKSVLMGRKGLGIELNTEYYKDSIFYNRSIVENITAPTLFEMEKIA